MNPGEMDQIVIFRTVIKTQGDGGTWIDGVPDDLPDRARVMELRARESSQGGRFIPIRKIRVTVRRRTDLNTNMVLLWQDEVFSITEIPKGSERNQFMDVFAELE